MELENVNISSYHFCLVFQPDLLKHAAQTKLNVTLIINVLTTALKLE